MTVFLLFSLPLTQILPPLIHYRYILLFPIMVVEGPIITIIAGFLVSLGSLDFPITYAVAVTADLVGDTLYYLVGRFGANRFVDRWGKYLRISWEQIETLKRHFERHVGKTLLMGKLTHGAGGLILLAAGVAKIPYLRFFWFNLLGTLPKSLVLLLVGYYFGHGYRSINRYLNEVALLTLCLVVLGGLALILYGFRRSKKV
jgi:membrane protein DedA with SNARE-associated domain